MKEKADREKPDKRLLLSCGRAACFCVWRNAHNCSLSPVSSSEPLIGVPSAFDTNIYTTHASGCSETPPTHTPSLFPSLVHKGGKKLQSVRFVTAGTKTSLSEGEEGEDGREEEEEEAERLLHPSQVRLGSRGHRSPFPSPRRRAKEAAGTDREEEEEKKLNDKTRCG